MPAILPHVFQSALIVHRETTCKLLEESAARGEANVSVLAMTTARNAALNSLRNTNEMLKQNISMDELERNMALVESDAVQQFVQSRGGKK
jgi:cell division protein FtsB